MPYIKSRGPHSANSVLKPVKIPTLCHPVFDKRQPRPELIGTNEINHKHFTRHNGKGIQTTEKRANQSLFWKLENKGGASLIF